MEYIDVRFLRLLVAKCIRQDELKFSQSAKIPLRGLVNSLSLQMHKIAAKSQSLLTYWNALVKLTDGLGLSISPLFSFKSERPMVLYHATQGGLTPLVTCNSEGIHKTIPDLLLVMSYSNVSKTPLSNSAPFS